MYRDGAARKVLGDRDFVFGHELTRENLLKIAVTSDELREVNVYKVCVQPLDGSEFTVHVDVAACRISDLKSQIRAKNGMDRAFCVSRHWRTVGRVLRYCKQYPGAFVDWAYGRHHGRC